MGDHGAVIVGAGECGARAAFALREEGYAGPITLLGAERHLPYERPPLSKDGMSADAPGIKTIAEASRYESAAIRLMLSTEVASIDRARKSLNLGDGTTLPYETLLLATGARPRLLSLADTSRHCLYLRTHDDAGLIAARLGSGPRVIIIGGGFIGLELAASARGRGCDVTVLEALPRLLARAVPEGIAAVLADAHLRNGVDIRFGATIAAIEDKDSGVEVRLGDGSVLQADLCIIGIGAIPNVELAERAGLATDNGICVDETLRTNDPAIFAAGDCCSFPLSIYGGRRVRLEAWRNAQEQGTLAAGNMLGRHAAHASVPWFWSDQYDLTIQIAGLADEGRTTIRRNMGEDAFILFHLADDGRLVAASGIGRGNAVARDIRLAEMLIARSARPVADKLADAEIKLKSLLAA
ncbi:MAG: FAD-dependent oxidoreductase [Mesorhizobium sp.]|nr:FAD-dependent oxidoreductase [Mesorhizobium sp.]MBL8576402.1 FAD-dependent oxidoreductase [Mesorhizobium sp.]